MVFNTGRTTIVHVCASCATGSCSGEIRVARVVIATESGGPFGQHLLARFAVCWIQQMLIPLMVLVLRVYLHDNNVP